MFRFLDGLDYKELRLCRKKHAEEHRLFEERQKLIEKANNVKNTVNLNDLSPELLSKIGDLIAEHKKNKSQAPSTRVSSNNNNKSTSSGSTNNNKNDTGENDNSDNTTTNKNNSSSGSSDNIDSGSAGGGSGCGLGKSVLALSHPFITPQPFAELNCPNVDNSAPYPLDPVTGLPLGPETGHEMFSPLTRPILQRQPVLTTPPPLFAPNSETSPKNTKNLLNGHLPGSSFFEGSESSFLSSLSYPVMSTTAQSDTIGSRVRQRLDPYDSLDLLLSVDGSQPLGSGSSSSNSASAGASASGGGGGEGENNNGNNDKKGEGKRSGLGKGGIGLQIKPKPTAVFYMSDEEEEDEDEEDSEDEDYQQEDSEGEDKGGAQKEKRKTRNSVNKASNNSGGTIGNTRKRAAGGGELNGKKSKRHQP